MRVTCFILANFVAISLCSADTAGVTKPQSVACGLPNYEPCATLPSSLASEHLRLRPNKEDIGFIEIGNSSYFATNSLVILDKVVNGCYPNGSTYFPSNTTMDIDGTILGNFNVELNPGGGRPVLKTELTGQYIDFTTTPTIKASNRFGKAQWLTGDIQIDPNTRVTAYIFMLDEKSGSATSGGASSDYWKHYLVEIYDNDPKCDRDRPSTGTVVKGVGKTLQSLTVYPRQPTTGNGWEPH